MGRSTERHSLVEDVPHPAVSRRHDIDLALQRLRELVLHGAEFHQARARLYIDEQVDIGARTSLTACHRSEHPNVAPSVGLDDAPDLARAGPQLGERWRGERAGLPLEGESKTELFGDRLQGLDRRVRVPT